MLRRSSRLPVGVTARTARTLSGPHRSERARLHVRNEPVITFETTLPAGLLPPGMELLVEAVVEFVVNNTFAVGMVVAMALFFFGAYLFVRRTLLEFRKGLEGS